MALIDLDVNGSMILYQGTCPLNDGYTTPLSTSEGEATAELANHIITHSQIIKIIKVQVTPPA